MTPLPNQIAKEGSQQLLERSAPPGYEAEQTEQLATLHPPTHRTQTLSVLIFRLGPEWLALPAECGLQIAPPAHPHTLPHRSNSTLLGVINLGGQLLLKVSLYTLLGLPKQTSINSPPQRIALACKPGETRFYPRMIVIEKTARTAVPDSTPDSAPSQANAHFASHQPEIWAFDVDELHGIHTIAPHEMLEADRGSHCICHTFLWQQRRVCLLDDCRLFEALRQQAL